MIIQYCTGDVRQGDRWIPPKDSCLELKGKEETKSIRRGRRSNLEWAGRPPPLPRLMDEE
jgi:hypothetical protein